MGCSVNGVQAAPKRRCGTAKAGAVKRRQIELAALHGQPGAPLADRIQARLRLRETQRLAFGGRAEAIHIMMAIAFYVCNARLDASRVSCCTASPA